MIACTAALVSSTEKKLLRTELQILQHVKTLSNLDPILLLILSRPIPRVTGLDNLLPQ